MRHAALVFSALLLLPTFHSQAQAQQFRSEIDIDVEDMDLGDLMDDISRQVGVNILVHPDVHERVTIRLRQVPWKDAVRVIARLTKCQIKYFPGPSRVMQLAKPPRVSIQCTGANVRTVLMQLADYAKANIILAADVRGTITLDLRDVEYMAAMRAVVKTIGGGKFTIVSERNYKVGGDPKELAKNEPATKPATPTLTLSGRLVKLGEESLELKTEEGKVVVVRLPEGKAVRERLVETLEDARKGSRLVLTVTRLGKRYVVSDLIAQSR